MDLTFQERLIKVQQELKAPKSQRNNFGNYNYRNCEDILEAVKPLLAKYELCLSITDEVHEVVGIPFVNARAVIFDADGTKVEVSAQAGIDPNRKGMDISQSFGSSSSYARKYALNGLFLIDDTKDADATNTHNKTVATKPVKASLKANSEAFNKAKEYVAKGGDLADVKKKYTVTKQVEQLLIN